MPSLHQLHRITPGLTQDVIKSNEKDSLQNQKEPNNLPSEIGLEGQIHTALSNSGPP
jgi:hypothetical protein